MLSPGFLITVQSYHAPLLALKEMERLGQLYRKRANVFLIIFCSSIENIEFSGRIISNNVFAFNAIKGNYQINTNPLNKPSD